MIDWWQEVGPVAFTGMGEAPISFVEIDVWAHLRRITITPWEALTLRELSTEYISMQHKAKKPECPAPYIVGFDTEDNRTRVSKGIALAFRNLKCAPRDTKRRA